MNIAHMDSLLLYENVEARIVNGKPIPTGLGILNPNPSQHNFYIKVENKIAEVIFESTQDRENMYAEFSHSQKRLCNVKYSEDDKVLLDLYAFAGGNEDFGETKIFVDKPKVGALQDKEHRKPTFDEICSYLPIDCALVVNGEKYFIIQANYPKKSSVTGETAEETAESDGMGESEPVSLSGAFSIFGSQGRRVFRVEVVQKNFSADGTETFFAVNRIARLRNGIEPERNFHLIKGTLVFSNQREKADELNRTKLNEITSNSGSYLNAWRSYTNARGNRIMAQAQRLGAPQYSHIHPVGNKIDLYFDEDIAESIKEASASEIIVYKDTTPLPLFLQKGYKTIDFEAYCEEKETTHKERKGKRSNKEDVEVLDNGVACEIVEVDGKRLTIKPVSGDASKLPQKGYIVLSMLGEESQISRQQNAWKMIAEGRAGINYLGNLLEGSFDFMGRSQSLKEPKFTERMQKKVFKNPPTEAQVKAIKMALQTPDIVLIQGPPGTGKTTVISAILEILSEQQDKRGTCAGQVLINAYQHDAVNNMIMDDKGQPRISVNGLPTWKFGKRQGEGDYDEHIDRWCHDIAEKVFALNPSIDTSDREDELYALCDQYIYDPTSHNRSLLLNYISTLPLSSELAARAREFSFQSAKAEEAEKPRPSLMQKINALRTNPQAFADDGAKRAEDLYFTLDDMGWFVGHSDARKLLEEAQFTTKATDGLLTKLGKLKMQLLEDFCSPPRYVVPEVDEVVVNLCTDVEKFLASNTSKADKKTRITAEWVRALQAGPAAFSRAIKDLNFVYAATSQQSDGRDIQRQKKAIEGIGSVRAKLFDTVIVDEAARAAPPDLLIPMCKAARRIILVGDHRQLPQLIDDDLCTEAGKKLLGETGSETDYDYKSAYEKSLFELLFKQLKTLEEKDGIKRTVTLDKQFRTHPLLGKFCSRMFYDPYGEHYESPRGAEEFAHNLPGIENKAAIWIDIPNAKGKEKRLFEGSWVREVEADCIVEKMLSFVKAQAKAPAGKKLSFGVISFYRGQANLIQEKLDKHNLKDVSYKVGTVDAFQGMEFDVVFLSVVRTNKKAHFGFLTSFNRMCVSMSRQKKALIVVGDAKFATTEEARKKDAMPALAEFYDLCAGKCKEQDNEGYGVVQEWNE